MFYIRFYQSFLIILLIFAISGEIEIRHYEDDEVLTYQASLDGEKSPPGSLQENDKEKGNRIWMIECPLKRKEPTLSLIRKELAFDQSCQMKDFSAMDRGNSSCKRPRNICHKEFPVPQNMTPISALSILIKANCSAQRRMRLISWDQFHIDIACKESTSFLSVCNHQQQTDYPISGRFNYTSIIVEDIRSHSSWPLQVVIDGQGENVVHQSEENTMCGSEDSTAITIGYNVHSATSGNVGTLHGRIHAIDIFLEGSYNREDEYQYMTLLSKKASYPECLCPQHNNQAQVDICRDHTLRFTGAPPGDKWFTPIRSLSDGLVNASLKYGFFSVVKDSGIRIKLEQAAEITKFEMLAVQGSVWVYKDRCDCGTWHNLFCTEHIVSEYNAKSCESKSKKDKPRWKDVPGEVYKRLVWSPSGKETPLITRSLLVTFSNRADIGSFPTPFPGAIPILEITIRGRPLHTNNDKSGYFCFHGTKKKIFDECGRCTCRTGSHKLSGRDCKPFISGLEPAFGPISGGTLLTITGGLLAPDANNLKTRVWWAGFKLCETSLSRNDTHIICRVVKGDKSMLNISRRAEVSIQISGVYYKLETKRKYVFKYLPDPEITNVTPYKAFLSGSTVTVKGKHLNSLHTRSSNRYMHLKLIGRTDDVPCAIKNTTTMVCEIPPRGDTTVVKTYIGFSFDGCVKYKNLSAALLNYGAFMIYPPPVIFKQDIVTLKSDGDFLELTGKNLDSGSKKEDYKVTIGNEECKIIAVESTVLHCYPKPLSRAPENATELQIVVKVHRFVFVVGHLKYAEKTGTILGLIVGGTALLVVCVLLVIGFCLVRNRKLRRSSDEAEMEILRLSQSIEGLPLPSAPKIVDCINKNLKQSIAKFLIDNNKLIIKDEIGKGNFGNVHRGLMEKGGVEVEVAIKTLKDHTQTDVKYISEFLDEATVMRNLKHPNVLPLLGVVLDESSCSVVLPFMEKADLRTHISANYVHDRTSLALIQDVAKGMEYLARQKFIHRDLAARNCMVDAAENVMIGDFGLARDIYAKDYYRPGDNKSPLPIKWMAPESIEMAIFSHMTDVWSFAVLMWEVFSRGARPYSFVENWDMGDYLTLGKRLEKPDNCPQLIYDLMGKCWRKNPVDRPTFYHINVDLRWIESKIHAFETGVQVSGSSGEASAPHIRPLGGVPSKKENRAIGLHPDQQLRQCKSLCAINDDQALESSDLFGDQKWRSLEISRQDSTVRYTIQTPKLPVSAPRTRTLPRKIFESTRDREGSGRDRVPKSFKLLFTNPKSKAKCSYAASDDYLKPRKCEHSEHAMF